MCVEPVGDFFRTHGGMNVFIEDDAHDFGFFFIDEKLTFFELVAIRSKAAIPFSFTSLLSAAFHCLNQNVFSLNFGNSGEHGNHQLAGVFGGINAVFDANEVDTIILHALEGGENVCGVSTKTRQFENKNKRNMIFTGFDILKHLKKFRSTVNILTRFSLVAVFPGDEHVLELRVLAQLVLLRVQAVAVHLHGGGDAGVDVALHSLHGFSSRWSGFAAPACSSSPRRNLS